MILLLGGTTEALPIAQALAGEGFEVLLSTATAIPPRGTLRAEIRRQTGMLDAGEILELIRAQGIRMVVDATHPYAAAISTNAWNACQEARIPYVAYERPRTAATGPDIHWAENHEQAADLACAFGAPVLLTIGVRNLAPYVAAARRRGVKLVARVLDHPASVEACQKAGLDSNQIVSANGPFSVTENSRLIARHHIGVLVTKDSGQAGGVQAKITAARNCVCQVVLIKRPSRPQAGHPSIPALMQAVRSALDSDRKERATKYRQ